MIFNEEVKGKTRLYHILNNVFLVIALIGTWVIATEFSTYDVGSSYYSRTETDTPTFLAIFGGVSITYFLLYSFLRVTINNYGENVRANYYRQNIWNTLEKK